MNKENINKLLALVRDEEESLKQDFKSLDDDKKYRVCYIVAGISEVYSAIENYIDSNDDEDYIDEVEEWAGTVLANFEENVKSKHPEAKLGYHVFGSWQSYSHPERADFWGLQDGWCGTKEVIDDTVAATWNQFHDYYNPLQYWLESK